MSRRRSTPAGGLGGDRSQRAGAPVTLAEEVGERSANAIFEDILRDAQVQVDAGMALVRRVSSAPSSSSSSRFCPPLPSCLGRGVARRFSPSRRSAARSSSEEQAASGLAGTSGSALEAPTRIESVQEASPEQCEAAVPTRHDFGVMMRNALGKIHVDADGSEMQAPFRVMQQAVTGLMELSYGKANPPDLPHEFATKWQHNDDDPLDNRVMDNPVILASGYSVDESYHRWSDLPKNQCPVTNKTMPHSFAFPNNLLRDMIAAWRLDHSLCSSTSSSTVETPPMAPSEEQIEDILAEFSKHSALQKQALNKIHCLSRISKGAQPCLEKWPVLIPVLIDLQKNWKSTWTREMEESRLSIILNLSVHTPNRVILAGMAQLPAALKKIAGNVPKLGCPKSPFAKVASIVANLSQFQMFRKGILDVGGMEMLLGILKIEDGSVRKEAVAAIWGLCTEQEGKDHAQSCQMAEILIECLTITDEALFLLDCLQKHPDVVHKLSGKVVELVNIIVMADQKTELIVSKAVCSAISLVHDIVRQDVCKMREVKNLEDFKKRLMELASGVLPLKTLLQSENIISMLETPPAPAHPVEELSPVT